jgi:hypothetical protein
VLELRRGLREGDVEAVREALAWDARPPWERDLLVDLTAAEGLESAVAKVRRFWAQTTSEIVVVRTLANGEAEVYEEIRPASGPETLHVATLLRLSGRTWRVVHTFDVPGNVVQLVILRRPDAPPLDASGFTKHYQLQWGATAEMLDDGDECVLGHPAEGWLARVRGPRPVTRLRTPITDLPRGADAPSEHLELSMAAETDRDALRRQMTWLARVAAELADYEGAPWIYVTRAEKRTATRMFAQTVGDADDPSARSIAASWVRLATRGNWTFTRGLSQLGQPEVELELDEWPDVSAARRLVGTVAMGLIDGYLRPEADVVIRAGGFRCRIEPGRRGPDPAKTYGPAGAITIRPAGRGKLARSGFHRRVDL